MLGKRRGRRGVTRAVGPLLQDLRSLCNEFRSLHLNRKEKKKEEKNTSGAPEWPPIEAAAHELSDSLAAWGVVGVRRPDPKENARRLSIQATIGLVTTICLDTLVFATGSITGIRTETEAKPLQLHAPL